MLRVQCPLRPRRSANNRSGPRTLIRMILAFGFCYPRSSPLLVRTLPARNALTSSLSPSVPIGHHIHGSPHTHQHVYPARYFNQLHTLSRTLSHSVKLVYLTSKSRLSQDLTRPLSPSVPLDHLASQTVAYSPAHGVCHPSASSTRRFWNGLQR